MGKARIRLAMAMAAIPVAAGIALAAPAMAFADTGVGQDENAGQYSGTSQIADPMTWAPQHNDASNVAVLSDGPSGVLQADPNHASSTAGNASDTDQSQRQHQHNWIDDFYE